MSLTVRDDRAGLDDLLDVAQREQACCPFFEFALAIEADRLSLSIRVPPDAVAVLDELCASLSPP